MSREIRIVPDAAALARAATVEFVQLSAQAIAERGRFTVALSGGSTPKAMFQLLAGADVRDTVAWDRVHLFWGDERHVPPDHADSNYRMTREALLSALRIPEGNVHRMAGENPNASEAAAQYAQELRDFFGLAAGEWPQFDLVLLGMGPDGHCASLFPGTFAVREREALVVAPWVDKFSTYRITLTPPALNHARQILFLIGGADKAETLRHVLQGPPEPDRYPSQVIAAVDGNLLFLIDQAAAGRLEPDR